MEKKDLTAKHKEFYEEWGVWKAEVEDQNLPRTGVYFLKANRPIGRVLGKDEEGILYIGKGVIFSPQTRLGKLINAVNGTEKGAHGAGDYHQKLLKEKFPIDTLNVSVHLSEAADDMEKIRIKAYKEKFGELPPLNNRL